MREPIFHVDAFTDRPFSGNPAAVCILSDGREDDWMQNVAREVNLSETAFLRLAGEIWSLRWFTPAVEVDLCGHATLASAHVLWTEGHVSSGVTLRFQTRSGELFASGEPGRIELDFPCEPASACPPPPEALSASASNACVPPAGTGSTCSSSSRTSGSCAASLPTFGGSLACRLGASS